MDNNTTKLIICTLIGSTSLFTAIKHTGPLSLQFIINGLGFFGIDTLSNSLSNGTGSRRINFKPYGFFYTGMGILIPYLHYYLTIETINAINSF